MSSEDFRLFTDNALEVSIHDLVSPNGKKVNQSWGQFNKTFTVVIHKCIYCFRG